MMARFRTAGTPASTPFGVSTRSEASLFSFRIKRRVANVTSTSGASR
jgi:hypothetical protein